MKPIKQTQHMRKNQNSRIQRLMFTLLVLIFMSTPSIALARITDCEHAVAQQKINACARQAADDLDVSLQTRVAVLAESLVESERQQFESEHEQWLTQHKQECAAEARAELGLEPGDGTPTLYPQIYAGCRLRITTERIKLLEGRMKENSGEQKIEPLPVIRFSYDSYRIEATEELKLQRLIAQLQRDPSLNLLIVGHTDERNSDEYNLALSEQVAASVRSYLVRAGIAPERLQTMSFGEENPIDPAHNEAAWAKNRRVEFSIVAP